jgi:hypothetical protein
MQRYSTAQTDQLAIARMLEDHAERVRREDARNPMCKPCRRNNHAWCTMDDFCMCPNTWDGEGWKENQERAASKKAVLHLTTHPAQGPEHHPESGPLSAGRRVWFCADCGFKSRWWKGCERFRYCTECERRHLEIERRALRLREPLQGAGTTEDASSARRGAGQGVQAPLPLAAHSGRKMTDSPCDK